MERSICQRRGSSCLHRAVSLLVSATLLGSIAFPPSVLGSLPDRAARDGASPTRPTDVPAEAPRSIDPATLRIPERLGHVVEVFSPEPKGTVPKRLILHLQDLHTQYEAQRAIAELIHELRHSTHASLVALEGGAGPGETAFFSDFPDPETNTQLASFFLKKGLFTGPVYYAVTHPGSLSLYGAEDPAAYLDHLKTYQVGHAKEAEASQQIEDLLAILHELQDTLYSKKLKTLTRKVTDYTEEKLGLSEYLQSLKDLAARQDLSLEAYPNLTRLFRLVNLERQLDRQAVEAEHTQLFEALSQRLTDDELQALLAHQLVFTSGWMSQAQYYKGLRRFGRKAGIRLTLPEPAKSAVTQAARLVNQVTLGLPQSPYANVIAYTESLLLSEALDYGQVSDELDQLVRAIKDRLFTTSDQRQLDLLLTTLEVLRDLYNVRLSPALLKYYQTHKAAFAAQPFLSFLDRQHRLTPALRQSITSLFEDLSAQERFYEIALKRDEALIANTLKQMDAEDQPVAILVAGGFHTEAFKRLLKDQGIAYVVITPTYQGQMDEELYSSLLLNRVPSVEELIRELSKDATSGALRNASHQGKVLVQSQGITSIDDQLQVQTSQHAVGRTDEDRAENLSKRRYLQETWTWLKTVLLSLKGWTVQQIQTTLAHHPTLAKVMQFTISANGENQVEAVVNGSTLTYATEEGAVRVASFERPPARQAVQVASVEPGANQVLPIGAGAVAPLAGTDAVITEIGQSLTPQQVLSMTESIPHSGVETMVLALVIAGVGAFLAWVVMKLMYETLYLRPVSVRRGATLLRALIKRIQSQKPGQTILIAITGDSGVGKTTFTQQIVNPEGKLDIVNFDYEFVVARYSMERLASRIKESTAPIVIFEGPDSVEYLKDLNMAPDITVRITAGFFTRSLYFFDRLEGNLFELPLVWLDDVLFDLRNLWRIIKGTKRLPRYDIVIDNSVLGRVRAGKGMINILPDDTD